MPWTILLLSVLVAGAGLALGGFSPGSTPGKEIVEGRVKENQPAPTTTPVPTNLGTIRGRVMYEDLATTVAADGSTTVVRTPRPVRFTEVVALDATQTTVISPATATTDSDGNFVLQVPLSTPLFPTFVARTTASRRANLEARTFAGALYMISSSPGGNGQPRTISPDQPDVTLIFEVLPATRQFTGALNILDAGLRGSDRVFGLTEVIPPLVTFFWERGERRGTFFSSAGGPNGGPAITILGGDPASDDTDEFDDGVILHEYGHFIAFAFSRDSSLGGPHGLSDVTNPPLAWSEGFASFFAGLTDSLPFLVDSAAISGTTPLFGVINLEGGRGAGEPRGIRSESTVYEVLWDLVDGLEGRTSTDGDRPMLTAMQFFTPFRALRATTRYVTVNDYLELLVATGAISPADLGILLGAPEPQSISFPAVGNDIVPIRPPGPDLPFTTNVTVTTRSPTDGRRFTLDESNTFLQVDLTRESAIRARLELDPGFTGLNADGHNIDLTILTAENALATDVAGTVITPLSPSEELRDQVEPAVVPAGRYIFWVHGRPDITTSLTNATSVRVTARLSLTVTP